MKIFQKLVTIAALLGGMTAGVQAQALLIGGFQGAGDPTDAGWIDANNSDPITTDPECSFVSGVVPGYSQSLAISVPAGKGFGYPTLELGMSPSQITAFEQNSWITFTFSVPAGTYTGGYSQIYNLVLNAPGYGYNNQSWANAIESGNTNSTTPGTDPNYYFTAGANNLQTMVVSFNYSSVEAAIQAGISNSVATNGPSYLQLTFQGNQGGGAPTTPAWYLNNVVLSQNPFGAGVPVGGYMVDDFSTNGVSNTNPTNDDYFDNTNEIYLDGSISNVYGNWFGGGFTSVAWSTNNIANAFGTASSPANGSMQLNVNPGNGQWVLHHADYSINPGVNSITYTDVEMDVKFDPSSISSVSGGSTNYGPLRIGVRPNGVYSVQDWFYYAPVITNGNNGWVHIAAPLSATDANQQPGNWGELLIGEDPGVGGWNGSGNQIIYVDNILFKGPTSVKIPPPTLSIQQAIPGLRIYAGSTANTYDRGVVTTTAQGESWLQSQGSTYPVTYAFSILSYPNANINQTMLELVPVNSLPSGNNPTGNEDSDYEAANGLWLMLNPLGGGQVTATLEWKTNMANANPGPGSIGATNTDGSAKYNPNYQVFIITNATALGTWQLKFTGDTTGTLIPPGGTPKTFTIPDPNINVDFANPVFAQFGLQPNSAAGEGLYETWGFIGITNISGGTQSEDFTHESSDFVPNETTGYPTSPSGFFEDANSANTASTIIMRDDGQDLYSVSWTTPAQGYNLVTGTSLLSNISNTWVSPLYYSGGNDNTAPRGVPALEGSIEVEVIPADNAATANGQPGGSIAPNAFFIMTTNTPPAAP